MQTDVAKVHSNPLENWFVFLWQWNVLPRRLHNSNRCRSAVVYCEEPMRSRTFKSTENDLHTRAMVNDTGNNIIAKGMPWRRTARPEGEGGSNVHVDFNNLINVLTPKRDKREAITTDDARRWSNHFRWRGNYVKNAIINSQTHTERS